MRLVAPNRIAWEGPDTPTGDRMGTFTMVYDEGWEATFQKQDPAATAPAIKMWGFLDWAQVNSTTVASHCGSVSVGTYHSTPAKPTDAPTGWGCYKATKRAPPAPRMHPYPAVPAWAQAAAGSYRPLPPLPLRSEMPRALQDNRPDAKKYAGLPASIDWDLDKQMVEMMRDQLTCGSCYAFASTSMLASRGRIAGVKDLDLSPQV